MVTLILSVITTILLVAFCLRPASGENQTFDINSALCVKGASLFLVIIYYFKADFSFGPSIFYKIVFIAMALFLFISGYGNEHSSTTKKLSPLKFLGIKIRDLYIPFLIIYIFHVICNIIVVWTYIFDPLFHLKNLLLIDLPSRTLWITKIVLVCYIIHAISKFIKNKLASSIFVLAVPVVLIVLAIICNMHSLWYSSLICYSLGVVLCKYQDNITSALSKIHMALKIILIGILGVLFLVTFVLSLKSYVADIIASILVSILCYIFFNVFTFNFGPLKFMGENSYIYFLVITTMFKFHYWLIHPSRLVFGLSILIGSTLVTIFYIETSKQITKAIKH